jgi:hypothetical protein
MANALVATFDSASDLSNFEATGTWTVSGGAAVHTRAAAAADALLTWYAPGSMAGATLVANVTWAPDAPSGYFSYLEINFNGQHRLVWGFDGFGINANVEDGGGNVINSMYVGHYDPSTYAWLKIEVGPYGAPTFSYSTNGSTWTTVVPDYPYPQPDTALLSQPSGVRLGAGTWQAVSPAQTVQLKSMEVTTVTPTVDGGSLNLSGLSNLASTAFATRAGAAALSAASNLTSGSAVLRSGSAALSALSSLSVGAGLELTGSALLSATGDLLAAGAPARLGTAVLSAQSSLRATAREVEILLGEALLDAVAVLDQIDGIIESFGEVELDGRLQGSLTADSTVYPITYKFKTPSRRVHHRSISVHVQGISVVRDGEFWSTVEGEVDFAAHDRVFLGGYDHTLTYAEYASLLAAGYGEWLTIILPQVPSDIPVTGSGYGSGPFGSGPYGQSQGQVSPAPDEEEPETPRGPIEQFAFADLSAFFELVATALDPATVFMDPVYLDGVSRLYAEAAPDPVIPVVYGGAALSASAAMATTASGFSVALGQANLSAASNVSVVGTRAVVASIAAFSAASKVTVAATISTPVNQSATAMPKTNLNGWRLLANEDFNTPVSMGNFAAAYPSWTAYDGLEDTSRNMGRASGKAGLYNTAKTATVANSVLDLYVHTENGRPLVAAPTPPLPNDGWAQKYGRYAVRFKSTAADGYKVAWLLWPAEPYDWSSGEIDFPEAELGSGIGFFSHQVDGDPSVNQFYNDDTGYSMLDWHTAVIEWSPNKLRFLLDGVEVGSTTDSKAIPHVPMFWVLQTETWLSSSPPPTSASGHVQIDWTAVWAYDTTATAPTT